MGVKVGESSRLKAGEATFYAVSEEGSFQKKANRHVIPQWSPPSHCSPPTIQLLTTKLSIEQKRQI